jgi:hypothetical protein
MATFARPRLQSPLRAEFRPLAPRVPRVPARLSQVQTCALGGVSENADCGSNTDFSPYMRVPTGAVSCPSSLGNINNYRVVVSN